MSQSGPTWIFDDYSTPAGNQSHASSDVHMLDYGIAELTTENGQLALHRYGEPRVSVRLSSWEKPRTTGTLESLVKQATRSPDIPKPRSQTVKDDNSLNYSTQYVVEDINPRDSRTTLDTTMSRSSNPLTTRAVAEGSTLVGSSTGSRTTNTAGVKLAVGKERHQGTIMGACCTVTSSRSRHGHQVGEGKHMKKISFSNKRSRADNVRNQSERTRRNRINQRLKILQRLIPDCSKTDKASVLDEVIAHIKQLETHIYMRRKSYLCPTPKTTPFATQEQFSMPIMPPNIGSAPRFGMSIPYPNSAAFSPMLPNPFMQLGLPSIMPYFNWKTQYTA